MLRVLGYEGSFRVLGFSLGLSRVRLAFVLKPVLRGSWLVLTGALLSKVTLVCSRFFHQ